jgi:hypothetical protein
MVDSHAVSGKSVVAVVDGTFFSPWDMKPESPVDSVDVITVRTGSVSKPSKATGYEDKPLAA